MRLVREIKSEKETRRGMLLAIGTLRSANKRGEPIPSTIELKTEDSQSQFYHTEDYIDYINNPKKSRRWLEIKERPSEAKKDLCKVKVTKWNIEGLAKQYYNHHPHASKSDFFSELRNPQGTFSNQIEAWTGQESEFSDVMDNLNGKSRQRELGAYYTPSEYCQLGLACINEAIARVPEGKDYIIIDRCAGTGNLEKVLTNEQLSHVIMSTYEDYEYEVLKSEFSGKVKAILKSRDALYSGYYEELESLIEGDPIRIIYENPPYSEGNGVKPDARNKMQKKMDWKKSDMVQEMRKTMTGTQCNDLSSVFIWTAFNKVMKHEEDSLIVYSPIKYWKSKHVIDKRCIKGYALNRKHFHTPTDACIILALWSNEDMNGKQGEFTVEAMDIEHGKLKDAGQVKVKQIHKSMTNAYYDRRVFDDDEVTSVVLDMNGQESEASEKAKTTNHGHGIYNDNIIGYLKASNAGFDYPRLHSVLVRGTLKHGRGFHVRTDNLTEVLPLFVVSRYMDHANDWRQLSMIMKSGDGEDRFKADVKNGKLDDFLCKCLIWTCLTHYSHIRSFRGSDGRLYRNELCFDGEDTAGYLKLQEYISKGYKLSEDEEDMIEGWKRTAEKIHHLTGEPEDIKYGVYQASQEIEDEEIQRDIEGLKEQVKQYYTDNFPETLFQYEFLK